MLQSIRDKAQGWIAWAIIIFISIPFALWGIQSYLGTGGEAVDATVNGVEIAKRDVDQRAREFRDRMRSQLGENYQADMFDDNAIRGRVVDQLIDERVLLDAADQWDLRVGDQTIVGYIKTIPGFQSNGKFDSNVYNNALKNQGLSQRGFEQMVRQDYITSQMRDAIIESAFVTKRELAEKARLQDQKRDIDYVIVPAVDFSDKVQTTEEELKDFYNNNTAKYAVPERAKLAYLLLELDEIAKNVEVEEATLKSYFETHQSEFQVPEERQVLHILIQAEEGDEAVDKAALEKIENIKQQLSTGGDFASLAKANSDDPGSAENGGDLGWVSKGLMDEAFERAAFGLALNTVSEPVRSAFGYHLIKVVDQREGGPGSFETFRDEVEAMYQKAEAENQFFDYSERLANLVYETPDSLDPAAETLGLTVQESDWVTRQRGIPGLASPKITLAAFSGDVLKDGNNSEVIELSPERIIVVRVIEHEDERIRAYEEVSDLVTLGLTDEKTSDKAKEAADALLKQVEEGADLSAAATQPGWSVINTGLIANFNANHPSAVVRKAFSLQNAEKPVYESTLLPNGDYAVLTVKSIQDGNVADLTEAEQKAMENRLLGSVGNKDFQNLTADIRSRASVEIIPDVTTQN